VVGALLGGGFVLHLLGLHAVGLIRELVMATVGAIVLFFLPRPMKAK
jgi:uncharacterized membrane protein YeaQ/YmgE (transglycosylase-associated protein family)